MYIEHENKQKHIYIINLFIINYYCIILYNFLMHFSIYLCFPIFKWLLLVRLMRIILIGFVTLLVFDLDRRENM